MKKLLLKTFLVLVWGGVVSNFSASAQTTIGATDKIWGTAGSSTSAYTLKAGQQLTVDFTVDALRTSGATDFDGFIGILAKSDNNAWGANQYCFVRSCGDYAVGGNWNNGAIYNSASWGTGKVIDAGSNVSMNIKRDDNLVIVTTKITTSSSTTYTHRYIQDIGTTNDIYAFLAADYAQLTISNIVVDDQEPTDVYTNDFSTADGLSFAGITSSSLVEDDTFGHAFQNTASASARTNYLIMPDDLLAHSAETEALTIGFWVNAKNAGSGEAYNWAPLFTAYGAAPNPTNTWPMLACQYRGVLQVNCTGYSDFEDTQNANNVNALYHQANGQNWLADNDWHYYTVVFVDEVASVYFDGVLKNRWYNTKLADRTQRGLFSNGAELKYICLGGNQAWDWNDNDAGFRFAKFRLQNSVMTAEDIQTQMRIDKGELATVKIGATGYTTYASSLKLDLSDLPEGLTAYKASTVGESTVSFSPVEVAVPAETGLLFKGTPSKTYIVPVAASAEALTGNLLVGCVAETPLTTNANYYVMVNDEGVAKFQSLSTMGATIPAGKAYLNATGAGARMLTFNFDADATDIRGIDSVGAGDTGVIYDLQGRRVANPTKGVYIVNGKKVVIK